MFKVYDKHDKELRCPNIISVEATVTIDFKKGSTLKGKTAPLGTESFLLELTLFQEGISA